ncbi:MAG: hypothetical protein WCH10_00335 [bacterium]
MNIKLLKIAEIELVGAGDGLCRCYDARTHSKSQRDYVGSLDVCRDICCNKSHNERTSFIWQEEELSPIIRGICKDAQL